MGDRDIIRGPEEQEAQQSFKMWLRSQENDDWQKLISYV